MWNLAAPPSFQGLREDKDLKIYIRHLPHWRQEGATYFVTFRFGDSLPQSKLRELSEWRKEWEKQHSGCRSAEVWDELSRETIRRIEAWLDQGMGSCLLKHPEVSATVAKAVRHFDGRRYQLGAYVVMPNHVHTLVRPLGNEEELLEWIIGSWKRFSARRINQQLGRNGSLWQEESFDRIVRDEEHLYRCLQYIGSNAKRAGLPPQASTRWVHPEWVELGWDFIE
jgi:putative transposase